MIKAVLFDAIDTLFAAYPDKVGMYMRIIEKHTGMKVSNDEMTRVWDKVLSETESAAEIEACKNGDKNHAWDRFNETILEELGYEGDISGNAKKIHFEAWGNPDNFRLHEDVMPTLEYLKNNNFLIGCVSNEDGYLESFFKYFHIRDYFKFIITSEEFGCEKPSPGIFLEAIRICSYLPSEVLFVGDSYISDYKGSLAVGMKPVLIDRTSKSTDDSIVSINDLRKIEGILND